MHCTPSSVSLQGIGPSLGLVLATKLGYDASLKAAQTIEVATRMRYLVPIMYLGSYIMMIIAYGVVFNLDKRPWRRWKAI